MARVYDRGGREGLSKTPPGKVVEDRGGRKGLSRLAGSLGDRYFRDIREEAERTGNLTDAGRYRLERDRQSDKFVVGQRVKFHHARFGDGRVSGVIVGKKDTQYGTSFEIKHKGQVVIIPATAVST